MTNSLTSVLLRPEHCDPLYLLETLGKRFEHHALLESLDRSHPQNDFSFLALGRRDEVTVQNGNVSGSTLLKDGPVTDPLEPFRTLSGNEKNTARLTMGYIGFLSFESLRTFEKVDLEADPLLPDGNFFLPEVLVKIDHERREVMVTAHADTKEDLRQIERVILASPFHDDAKDRIGNIPAYAMPKAEEIAVLRCTTKDDYCEAVKKAQEEILKGEAFQIVLSQELRLQKKVSPLSVYRELRRINPSPYMYYFRTPLRTIVGASPETLLRIEGRKMLYKPIAGTRKRTGDRATDERMKAELLADKKERCEHQMLVDLGRNDLGRVATIGSVEVHDAFHLEEYAHVFHIVSVITGELCEGCTALDALRSVFPAGTLTGAPKLRAVEIIRRLEKTPRGIYGGAFGYIDLAGNIDFAITIRTMLFDARGISLRVGAGVVKDSIPEREDDECLHKARSCLAAVFLASDSAEPL